MGRADQVLVLILYEFRHTHGLPAQPRHVIYSLRGCLDVTMPVFNTPGEVDALEQPDLQRRLQLLGHRVGRRRDPRRGGGGPLHVHGEETTLTIVKVGDVLVLTPRRLVGDTVAKKAARAMTKAGLRLQDLLADLERQRDRYNRERYGG